MNNQLTIEQDLIKRYEIRAREVFTHRNYYYDNPIWEKSEIQQKIKELKKIHDNSRP